VDFKRIPAYSIDDPRIVSALVSISEEQ